MAKKKTVTLPGSYWWKKYAPKDIKGVTLKQSKKKMSEQYGMYGTGMGESGTFGTEAGDFMTFTEDAPKLKIGQRVKIASGYGSGTEGILTSINSRTGEAIIRPTPLIPMMTHIKYLKPLHEEYGAGEDASTEAAIKYQHDTPGQENAEMPYQKTIRTIKKFMRSKYKRP